MAKWKSRTSVTDLPTGPTQPKSTIVSVPDEAMVVAFRRHTLLPLDDCLYALQAAIPHLTRSSLHRCLQRHGISRLPDVEGDKPAKKKFKTYPIGFFHIDIAELRTAAGKLYLFVAIDRTSKFAFVQLFEPATRVTASAFLGALVAAVPYKIHTVLTDNGIQFRFAPRYADRPTARYMTHMFEMGCQEHGIEHRFTKINHPWTNGRADEPHHQGGDDPALPLRRPQAARAASRRLPERLQFRPPSEHPEGSHSLRIHPQILRLRARTVHRKSAPSNAGTKHLGWRGSPLGD